MQDATDQRSEEFCDLPALMSLAQDAIIARSPAGEICAWNKGAEATYGWDSSEVLGRMIQDVLRLSASSMRIVQESLRTSNTWRGGLTCIHKDGREMIVDSRQVVRPGAGAGPDLVLEIDRDVTEAQRAVAQLNESEERFRLMVEGVQDYAIFMLDPEGVVVSWNSGAERMKGYRAEEIRGRHYSRFYPIEDVEAGKPDEHLRMAVAAGRVKDEGWRVRKDGTQFWADVVITAVRDSTGTLRGFAKVTRDFTERRGVEEKLGFQARLLDAVSDAVIATDESLVITSWNTGAHRLYGWRADEVLGRKVDDVLGTRFPESSWEEASRILGETGAWRGEVLQRHMDGRWLDVEAATIVVPDGPTRIVGVNRDIGDRKRAVVVEERNRIARELHDSVAQALYSMTLQARALELTLEGEARPPLDPVTKGIGNLRSQTGRALADMRALIFALRPGALAEGGLVAALQAHAGELKASAGVSVHLSVPTEPMALEPEVEENLYRLVQEALTNVVKHARASTVHVRLVWTETAGAFVKLEVSDDGVGFDAFLDRPGHLGLRMMAERTAKLGGTLHVESAPGRGTTVSAVIPQNRLGPILR